MLHFLTRIHTYVDVLRLCLHFDITISIQEVNIFNAEKVFADENRNCIVVLAKIF